MRRAALLALWVAPLLAWVGCGPTRPTAATINDTAPLATKPVAVPTQPTTKVNPATPATTKNGEPEKPADPWEEARAYFKKVKEVEKEKTEEKLKKFDKVAESKWRLKMGINPILDAGDYPTTLGQELWAAGFTEFVASRSADALDDKRFVAAFNTLNPKPTRDEVVNAAIRYSTTYFSIRKSTLEVIEKGGDTRDRPETHKAATAWTGK